MLCRHNIYREFLTSSLFKCELLASDSGRFTTGIHCIGGWLGPENCADVVGEKTTNTTLYRTGRRSSSVDLLHSILIFCYKYVIYITVGKNIGIQVFMTYSCI